MDDLFDALQATDVFNKLPKEDCQELVQLGLPRKLNPKGFLCHQGDVWPYVVYIASGRMRWVMLSVGGKEHQLFSVEAGEVFWAHSIFDNQPMPASLVAAKKTRVYLWNRETVLPILYRNPEAMFDITRMLTGIMRRAREIIYGLAFQPVAGRLANFILSSLDDPESPSLERDMTLEDMATICATSPEVICRLLYQFQADGVLQMTRTRISIKDQEMLKQISEMA